MKPKHLILIVGAVVIVVAFLLMRGTATKPASTSTISSDIPVSVVVVQRQKLSSNVSLAGTINASNDVNVVSETQGSVRQVRVKVGDIVKTGAVLVEIEDDIPRSNLTTAEISYQKAKRDFERSETLFQENSISIAQLDAGRLAMQAAENQLEIARRQLANTKVKAPIAGTVNTRFVDIGTMVQVGMPVANIVDITTLKVRVNVSEREAFQLKPGDPVDIITDVYPGQKFQARVDNIASKSDEAHTYPVEIKLYNNPKSPLKAGMFCRITFTSIAATEAIAIPRVTLVGSVKDAAVFVVRNGVASFQRIVVGKQTNEYLEVLSGLSEGDTVVTSGQNNLVDNARVLIVTPGQQQ
jgi:RND family efflux transporter MFP subunit